MGLTVLHYAGYSLNQLQHRGLRDCARVARR